MSTQELTRRDFFRMTAGAAAALPAAALAGIAGANERVRVGIVGFSDWSRNSLVPALLTHARRLNFDVVAVSDIWKQRREEGAAFLAKHGCRNVRACRNNDELYASGGIDAVIVGTCDFQHAMHGIEAVRAGCHAYIETPLAITMADAKAVRQAVRESGRIVQVGTQRRSSATLAATRERLRAGEFGNIVMADVAWNASQHGQWRRPELAGALREEDTDWKRFLANRPYEPWDPGKYIDYRLHPPYSFGIPCQWMVHQVDTVQWFAGLGHPRGVVASGGLYLWQDGRATPDTMTAVFDYGIDNESCTDFNVLYSSRMTEAASRTREHFVCEGATLDLGHKAADPVSEHMRNWMECIRTGRKPNADIEAGYDHSVTLCMTAAALQSGRRITIADMV